MADKPGWLARLLGLGRSKASGTPADPREPDDGASRPGTKRTPEGRDGEPALAESRRREDETVLPAGDQPPLPAARAPARAASAEEAVPAEWDVGDVILDLYEVRGALGEGGMGKVYKVHHRGWDVDLAVKCPKPEILARHGGADNFAREAETWVSLGLHPNAVSCYYVRMLGGMPRVFAEYVEAGSLSDWIRDRRLYAGGREKALERILDIAIQFAWGLDYAHEQALIHQDVKPANVMMTADGVAKVTDFGLARARAAAGETGPAPPGLSVMASYGGRTPAYCSPEQAEAAARAEAGIAQEAKAWLTRRTDVWSWGVSVLEMFFGEPPCPYGGQAAREVFESYLESGAVDEGIPGMPTGLADLLRGCFQNDPYDRPADMRTAADSLKDAYQRATGTPYRRPAPRPAELLADDLNNRGVSLWDLGKREDAERLWATALDLEPLHPPATYNLGLVRSRSGRRPKDDLRLALQRICAAFPHDWLPHWLLAQVQIEMGDGQAAVETLSQVAALYGNLEGFRTALALATDLQSGIGNRPSGWTAPMMVCRIRPAHTTWHRDDQQPCSPPSRPLVIPGIDLGNLNSAIAVVDGGRPRVLRPDGEEDFVPSAVYVDKLGKVLVGRSACRAILTARPSDGNGHTEFLLSLGGSDRFEFPAARNTLSATQLCTLVIRQLLNACRVELDQEPSSAVVSVLPGASMSMCDAILEAARQAGLSQVRLVQSPRAAALAYGCGPGHENARWLIFDLGRGTLEVTLYTVRSGKGVIPEQGVAGDSHLGDLVFARELLELVLGQLRRQYALERFSPSSNRDAWQRLRLAVDWARRALALKGESVVSVDGVLCEDERGAPVEVRVPIGRGVYERLITPHVERAVRLCQGLLDRNRLSPNEIDRVILVGTSRSFLVERMLSERLGIALDTSVDPMTALARGAAVCAQEPRLW